MSRDEKEAVKDAIARLVQHDTSKPPPRMADDVKHHAVFTMPKVTKPASVPTKLPTSEAPKAPLFDPALAARRRSRQEDARKIARSNEPASVNQGPIGEIVSAAYNSSREKIREFTVIDSIQAKLLPLLDSTNHMFQYILEVATFRSDPNTYRRIFADEGKEYPEQPDLIGQLIYRIAQWQKSRNGKNLEGINALALAEVEGKAQEEGGGFGTNNPYTD